jgi:hypothetical protein
VVHGQAPDWTYLLIRGDRVELRDARHLVGKDTWETQDALNGELGCSGHMLSVYSIGPAGENLVRFAAIQGDYGHVASKNGVGAVMGEEAPEGGGDRARGPRAPGADPRGLIASRDDIANELRTNPASKTLYEYGTLPGVVNLGALGALPIKKLHDERHASRRRHEAVGGPALRNGFDHRGHQCNACGMHHCHMQVLPSGKHKGAIVDEPEYEGWSGAGWTIGCTDPVAVSWLNTQLDRACVDVNEFGWLCGWVMECQEKGYITEQQLGFRLAWGDAEGADRLLQMISRREGLGDLLAEGTKLAAERLGGGAQECAIYTGKNASPRGHDHRGRWEEMLDTCTGSTGTLETGPRCSRPSSASRADQPVRPEQVARQVAGLTAVGTSRTRWERASSPRAPTSRTSRGRFRRPRAGSTRATSRCASGGGSARSSAPSTSAAASGTSSSGHPGATGRRRSMGPRRVSRSRSTGVGWSNSGTRYGLRPRDRATQARDAPRAGPRVDDPGRLGRRAPEGMKAAPSAPLTVPVEVLSWVNRMVGGPGTGQVTVDATVPRGSTVRAVLGAMSERYPELGARSGIPTRPRELGDNIEVLVNNAVLGLTHDLDSEVLDGERITLLGQYMGG